MRTQRGRLEAHAGSMAALVESLERLWRIARSQSTGTAEALYQLLRLAAGLRRDLLDEAELAHSTVLQTEDDLRAMRLVPATLLVESLERALRDACRRTEKEARLSFVGGETNLDRRLLEQLKVPLLHLVRNAVDHGVEPKEVREAIGKPPATVTVAIEQHGREIVIRVRDDGRGIDVAAVRRQSVERGFLDEDAARSLPDEAVYELLFRSGLSTAETVTELSGRGVGLDVARQAVLKLNGVIKVASAPGQGTTFTFCVPLTVSSSEVMLIEESGRLFGLPQSCLDRIIRVRAEELISVGRRLHVRVEGQSVPVTPLAPLVSLTARHEGAPRRTVAILRAGTARLGLICERFLGSYDLVLRPLPLELQALTLLGAAAILPTGQPVLVLSPTELLAASEKDVVARTSERRSETILIADDSITTRTLLRTALEASGFRVRTASDGDEALRLALSEHFDLVVSDVRMPRLDGYALTNRLRAHPRTARTPIVLFSSLDKEEDRRRGVACGAQAYLTKAAFDRGQLLEVISSLIRGA
jgi:two-component system chemotaxis sensor kinase CheA